MNFQSDGRLCNQDLQYLQEWVPNSNLNEIMSNYLTPQGNQDMRLLARRLQSQFPEVLRSNPGTVSYQTYKVFNLLL